jgi:hypothetical protein
MTEQDRLLAQEDARFFAIDKGGTGLAMLATTEKLPDKSVASFGLPSGPALGLNLAWSAHRKRIAIDVNALFDLHPPPQGTWPENHSPLFDYLELAVTEIIFSYTAIEGAVNELITPSSKYHRPQKGGRPPVVMVGADIERKISLDEKLKKALPEILNIKSPAGETIWHKYSDLQELRDRPVHLKSIDRKASGPEDETVWGRLLRLGTEAYPALAQQMIAHFYPTGRRWLDLLRSA